MVQSSIFVIDTPAEDLSCVSRRDAQCVSVEDRNEDDYVRHPSRRRVLKDMGDMRVHSRGTYFAPCICTLGRPQRNSKRGALSHGCDQRTELTHVFQSRCLFSSAGGRNVPWIGFIGTAQECSAEREIPRIGYCQERMGVPVIPR